MEDILKHFNGMNGVNGINDVNGLYEFINGQVKNAFKSAPNDFNTSDIMDILDLLPQMIASNTLFMSKSYERVIEYVTHYEGIDDVDENNITDYISIEHVKRCCMIELFIFKHRKGIKEECNEMAEKLKKNMNEGESSILNTDIQNILKDFNMDKESLKKEFIPNNCKCKLCTCVHNIYDKWSKYKPETYMEEILYDQINKMC
tara:strand:+ start:331 stop:939 length:609 start_codon:yes stop_codon:yes gene_type:complete